MVNAFVHVELSTTDPGKAKAFYSKLFSWKMEDVPMGPGMTYTMIRPGKSPEGGLMQSQVPNAPSFWLTYVDVDDVKAATAKAVSLGGKVMKDITEVPGMGSFTIITDPTGAALGLWQAAKSARSLLAPEGHSRIDARGAKGWTPGGEGRSRLLRRSLEHQRPASRPLRPSLVISVLFGGSSIFASPFHASENGSDPPPWLSSPAIDLPSARSPSK